MSTENCIRDAIQKNLPETHTLLSDLIKFPSTSGKEHEEMAFLHDRLQALPARVERVGLSDDLIDDEDYSTPVPDLKYDGRFCLRVVREGAGTGKTLLFNAHADVVPPSEGMEDAWSGRTEDGVVFGRGACDAKGQIATLYLVLRTLDALDFRTGGDVVLHLVVEEENGGNGTLAMARKGEQADGCIVMEPSDNKVYTSIRGAVWFRLVLSGKAGHSGQAGKTRSALLMARDAINILEDYHADLLKRSRGFELFDPYPNPMPITFGRLHAGNWPASAPSQAVIEGVLGLLPNKTKEEVCEEMRAALTSAGGESLAGNFDLTFMYRHDSSVLDPSHALAQTLLESGSDTGVSLEVSGMTASCDAWFYNNQLGIPTLVYGPGSLSVAHSKDEQISMADIAAGAEVLTRLTMGYCGTQA